MIDKPYNIYTFTSKGSTAHDRREYATLEDMPDNVRRIVEMIDAAGGEIDNVGSRGTGLHSQPYTIYKWALE